MMFVILAGWIAIVAAVCAAVVSYALLSWAFVVSKCWLWFVTAHFGLAAITMPQAICLVILCGLIKTLVNPEWDTVLNAFNKDEPKEGEKPKWVKSVLMLAAPWLILGFYWLIKIIFL